MRILYNEYDFRWVENDPAILVFQGELCGAENAGCFSWGKKIYMGDKPGEQGNNYQNF